MRSFPKDGGEKGFTLVEVLIVLFILGVIAAIATIGVSRTLKKQRVEAAGNQLQSFIESASVYAKERSRGVFVWICRGDAPGGNGADWWYCYLIEDTNNDGVVDYVITNANSAPPGNGTDTYISAEKVGLEGGLALPADIALATGVAGDAAWGGAKQLAAKRQRLSSSLRSPGPAV